MQSLIYLKPFLDFNINTNSTMIRYIILSDIEDVIEHIILSSDKFFLFSIIFINSRLNLISSVHQI